jgi:hypothetical protein
MKKNVLNFKQFIRINETVGSVSGVSAPSNLQLKNPNALGLETAKSLSSKIENLFKNESFWEPYKDQLSAATFFSWGVSGDDDEGGAFTAFQNWWNTNIAPSLKTSMMHQDYVTLLSSLLGEIKTKMTTFTSNDSLSWTIGTSTYTVDTDF